MENKEKYEIRLKKVVDALQNTDMDAILLNRLSYIAYLTGAVNSCSWVFITRTGKVLALVLDSDVDAYRSESAIEDIRPFHVHDPFQLFSKVRKELNLIDCKLGLELGRPGLAHHTLAVIRHAFPPDVQFVNAEPLLEELRVVKTDQEVEAVKKAVEITELGMETAVRLIKPGITENELALEVEYAMRKAGGRLGALNYVGSGRRSCIAHHTPSSKRIEKGEVVAIDLHGAFHGYCADLARTVVCGRADGGVAEAYAGMTQAVEETVRSCRQGQKMTEIRKIFYRKMKEAKDLSFTTGPVLHGVGIVNYEMPYFSFPHTEAGYPETLQANMVVAVSNIGLYSKQGWGVRVEDTVLVTDDQPVYLTRFPKELLVL